MNKWKKSERVPVITLGKGNVRDDELTAMNSFIYFIEKIDGSEKQKAAKRALQFLWDKYNRNNAF